MGKRKNLLIFNLKTDADDGVLGFTTDWINALAIHFNRVFVITMCAGRLDVSGNVSVYSVGKERGYSEPRRALAFYSLLWELLRSQRIDACFSHMMPLFAAMGWPLLRMAKIPIVMWYAHKSVSTVLRVATLLVDRVVASSESGFRLETPKLRIVGQGIDTNRFSPLPDLGAQRSRFTILTLGRISPIKRLEILIEAVAEVDKRLDVDLQVKIVGGPLSGADEEYLELLKKKSRDYGMEGQVEFVGNKSFPDVHRYYQSADCFVNVSDTDSADKAVLEAMSCGVPVITSNVAFREILGDELSSRWVIAKGDAVSLSDRIIAISSMTAAERKSLGVALRQIVLTDHSLPALSRKISGEIFSSIGNGNQ